MEKIFRGFNVSASIWQEAKNFCVQNNITLSDFITEVIKKELKYRTSQKTK